MQPTAQTPRLSVCISHAESMRLQKAWTKSGEFANRSQFIKAAINAYAREAIFDDERGENR